MSKDQSTNTSIIPADNPIGSSKDDIYGYAVDAKKLLEIIVNNKKQAETGAFVIGLKGEWGSGKTSYLNLLEEASNCNSDIINIRFNVWQSNSYDDLAQKLFRAIAIAFDDISIKSSIYDYSRHVIDAHISYLSALTAIFHRTKKTNELFDIVNKQIQSMHKTLIIQVDDLDRLTDDEVLYTLKLIRNIANFKHTFFIVAYDEEYIKECFKRLNINLSYLEKIFNVIYPLPTLRHNEKMELIKKELTRSLWLDANMDETISKFLEIIENNISMRGAKRLAGSVQCGLSPLKDESGNIMVDILDYILIQYLQIFKNQAYQFLANFRDDEYNMWSHKSIKRIGNEYVINDESIAMKDRMKDDEYKKLRLIPDTGEDGIDLTFRIFKTLFDKNRNGIGRISYINYFHVFFSRKFDKSLISKNEFENSFNSGIIFFTHSLTKWNNSYDRFSLSRLIAHHKCETEAEWRDFLTALLEIAPLSTIEYLWKNIKDDQRILPTPGLDLIQANGGNDPSSIKTFYNALWSFFFDPETLKEDTLETLQKKLSLYIFNRNQYLSIGNLIKDKAKRITEKKVFELYWSMYWSKKASYADFDEDFWYLADSFNLQEKLDVRNIIYEHIKQHIEEFLEYYPVNNVISDPYLSSLFTNYKYDPKFQSASGDELWKANYLAFLQGIEHKPKELAGYIQQFIKEASLIPKSEGSEEKSTETA